MLLLKYLPFSRDATSMLTKTEPWVLAKDETKKERLATVLYNLVEGISIGANLLEPFMPETSAKVLAQLNAQKRPMDSLDIFGMYKSGTKVVEKPEILFARLDAKETLEKIVFTNGFSVKLSG